MRLNKMTTQNTQQIERENRSGLVGKVAKTLGKIALLPIAGHFPTYVQDRIYGGRKLVRDKYGDDTSTNVAIHYGNLDRRGNWETLANFFSVVEEGILLPLLGYHLHKNGLSGAEIAGVVPILESIARLAGSAVQMVNGDIGANYSPIPSLEGYIPGKILEVGMKFYDKYKMKKTK